MFEAKPRSQDRVWKKDSERKNPGARRANPVLRATPGPPPAAEQTARAAVEESPQSAMVPVQYPEIRTATEVDLIQHALNMDAHALNMDAAGMRMASETARMQQMLGLQQQQMSPYWKQHYGQLGQGLYYPGHPMGDFWQAGLSQIERNPPRGGK